MQEGWWKFRLGALIEGKSFSSTEPDMYCALINLWGLIWLVCRGQVLLLAISVPTLQVSPRSARPGSIQNADNMELGNNFSLTVQSTRHIFPVDNKNYRTFLWEKLLYINND